MANCVNIELLRISANKLQDIPRWLFELPKLSWLAFSGNPASHSVKLNNELELFDWNDFEIKELLGEGASGLISNANWISKNKEVAIKVFKGDVTSDGLPEDEMNVAILAENHSNLVPVLGKIKNHPEKKIGLIMELIAPTYSNLGNPPNLNTCTRDVFDEKTSFTNEEALKIVKSIASVSFHLHSKGINHGDLYAHNILINKQADCLLGDYGAASFYDVNSVLAPIIERIEVRAFGCLVEDIFGLINKDSLNKQQNSKWQKLIDDCWLQFLVQSFLFAILECC
jgi:serine/threonine protein kinase